MTPSEIIERANIIAKRLMGWSIDIEEAMSELVEEGKIPDSYMNTPQAVFTVLDTKVWPCIECDIWCPTGELIDETCTGCR